MLTSRPILALFPTGEHATSAMASLQADGFTDIWMAATRPAPASDCDASATSPLDAPARNDVSDSSDGVFGSIGRFLSGRGDSLRRSLEDHGVDPLVAIDIDLHLPTHGAVVVVFPGERESAATATLREHGGDLRDPGDVRPADLAVRDVAPAPLVTLPSAESNVFYERP